MGMKKLVLSACGIALFCVPAMPRTKDLKSVDRTFLKLAADANMTEAHVGQMAEEQASESSVKDFGKKLTQDHTDAYRELAALAEKEGDAIPKGIDVGKNRSIEQLVRLKGTRFDREFVQHEIQDHEKAIAAFKREAADGHDADLKAYASKMLPVLEDHLHTAEKLAKTERHT